MNNNNEGLTQEEKDFFYAGDEDTIMQVISCNQSRKKVFFEMNKDPKFSNHLMNIFRKVHIMNEVEKELAQKIPA